VEELRAAVVSGKSQVVLTDVEAMVLALGHIGRSLASLRGDCVTLWGFLSLSLSASQLQKATKRRGRMSSPS